MPTAHTSDIIAPSLVRGSEHIADGLSNLPAHSNDDAIKLCQIGIGECFMSVTT